MAILTHFWSENSVHYVMTENRRSLGTSKIHRTPSENQTLIDF